MPCSQILHSGKKIGYTENYGKCLLGMLLMSLPLRYAAIENLRSYLFIGFSEPWTERWASLIHHTVRIEIYPFSSRGMIALAKRAMGYAWERTNKKLNHFKRTEL